MKAHRVPLRMLFVTVFIQLAYFFLLGCASIDQTLSPYQFYKRDIKLNINGEQFLGVAVPKKADKYLIKIESPGVISNITFQSCHREDVFTPNHKWWDSQKDKSQFEYLYVPNEIEKGKACLLDIGSYENKPQGRHSWGTIDFDMDVENLPATIECNGDVYDTNPKSVSICQAKTGSLQKIVFDHRVKAARNLDPRCLSKLKTRDEMIYIYEVPEAECTFYFGDQYGNFHRHTTLGYSTILIRGKKE